MSESGPTAPGPPPDPSGEVLEPPSEYSVAAIHAKLSDALIEGEGDYFEVTDARYLDRYIDGVQYRLTDHGTHYVVDGNTQSAQDTQRLKDRTGQLTLSVDPEGERTTYYSLVPERPFGGLKVVFDIAGIAPSERHGPVLMKSKSGTVTEIEHPDQETPIMKFLGLVPTDSNTTETTDPS